jgi:hypothetical protein
MDSTDQSMLSTGHRHRVTDALNETHAHLALRKHTEACKVQLSVTPGGFYCESFYVLPQHLLLLRFPKCDCPRVDLDRQRGDGDHAHGSRRKISRKQVVSRDFRGTVYAVPGQKRIQALRKIMPWKAFRTIFLPLVVACFSAARSGTPCPPLELRPCCMSPERPF